METELEEPNMKKWLEIEDRQTVEKILNAIEFSLENPKVAKKFLKDARFYLTLNKVCGVI